MLNNIIVRLIVYYVAVYFAFRGIYHFFPEIPYYLAQERAYTISAQQLAPSTDVSTPPREVESELPRLTDPAYTIPVTFSLIIAFLTTLPITWLYRWTRTPKKYNQSFVHTLLVIPIAIALIVFLVKGSLALAFSLAGIVAAVRFRTSLDEPIDSVYMLVAIGIGLAAGTQLVLVAGLASLMFVIVSLGIWKSNFGAEPAVLSGWSIDSSGKLGKASGASGTAPEKPYNAQIEVHQTKADVAQKAMAPILKSSTRRWQVADTIQNPDGTSTVVFDVRLKKSVSLPSLIRDIEKSGKGHINNVKLKGHEPRNSIIANAESRR